MTTLLDSFAAAITARPRTVLAALLAITLGLAVGSGLLTEQADNSVFLPDDSDVATATATLSDEFPDSAGVTTVTIIHRGDVLTPAGLAHIDDVATAATAEPSVAERLTPSNPVVSIADVYAQALETADLSTVSQAQIDGVTATLEDDPAFGPMLEGLVGEADGEGLAITSMRLRPLGDDDGLAAAELEIADIVAGVDGPLDVRSLSAETIDQESAASSSSSMTVLMFVAFAVIVLLLFVFFRTASDVALALVGLGLTIVGTLGFQGIMGPDGLGLIGSPNRITTMVPIMLIGLVVDYAIQSVARYRERRADGLEVAGAARAGLGAVALPLGLAAGTTIIAFLTNVASPIPATRDFGIVAAFGVCFGLLVMLTLVPAARTVLDGRRQARGTLRTPPPIADAIPGAGALVERVGVFMARRPAVVLAGTAIVTIVLGAAAFNITTEFDSNDFLPTGGETLTDLAALEEALGGQTETVTVLVEAELTDDQTLLNLVDVSQAFAEDRSRPTGAAGDITASLGTLLLDWTDDSGEPGDNYDAELVAIAEDIDQGLTLDPVGVQALLDRLESLDPTSFAEVAVNDPDGVDSALVQFDAFTGDQGRTPSDGRGHRGTLVRRPRPDHRHVRRHRQPRGDRRHDRQPDRRDRHHRRRRVDRADAVLLGHGVQADAGGDRRVPDRAGAAVGAGHDDAARHPLQRRHRTHHRAVDRDRGRLHDPRHPPLHRGARTPRLGRDGDHRDSADHRVGAARLGTHHRARVRGAAVQPADPVPAVRPGDRHHDPVRADRRRRGRAPADGGVGGVPRMAPAGHARRRTRRRSPGTTHGTPGGFTIVRNALRAGRSTMAVAAVWNLFDALVHVAVDQVEAARIGGNLAVLVAVAVVYVVGSPRVGAFMAALAGAVVIGLNLAFLRSGPEFAGASLVFIGITLALLGWAVHRYRRQASLEEAATGIGSTWGRVVAVLVLLGVAAGTFLVAVRQAPLQQLHDDELVAADYWSDDLVILSAGLGFDNIVGVPDDELETVRDAGGSYLAEPDCVNPDGPQVSTTTPTLVESLYRGFADYDDGLPLVFSWPVLSSTVHPEDFVFTLNTGEQVVPHAAGMVPNWERNERNVVVVFGELGNRGRADEPDAEYPVKVEIVDDGTPLAFLGPDGAQRAVGMTWETDQTPYDVGPRLVGAKLNHVGEAAEGEGGVGILDAGALPNDEFALYGGGDFRLRTLTSGGFSPDGLTGVTPDQYEDFFRIHATGEDGQTALLTEVGVDYAVAGGTLRVVGLADLGPPAGEDVHYDDCYVEDVDNYIDIILEGDEDAARSITHVEIPAEGDYLALYNPGGPGPEPFPDVRYTAPGPPDLEPVTTALDDPMRVSTR